MSYSFQLATRVVLYASSHRQDNTYHILCYTSRGTLAGMRNSSMRPPLGIDPTSHHTTSGRSTMQVHLLPLLVLHSVDDCVSVLTARLFLWLDIGVKSMIFENHFSYLQYHISFLYSQFNHGYGKMISVA